MGTLAFCDLGVLWAATERGILGEIPACRIIANHVLKLSPKCDESGTFPSRLASTQLTCSALGALEH
eukprot:3828986-Rhodomonas_salina.1